MALDPLLQSFGLLLGLSLFFGLAFEEFHAQASQKPPGGVRTFPLLALAGGLLYLLDRDRLLPVTAGTLILGAWLFVYYQRHLREPPSGGARDAGLVALVCCLLAYLIGPVAFAAPPWVAVGATVVAVLLLTARERLHGWAEHIEPSEIVTAVKFLVLTGIVLPLLPDHPVTSLTAITPYQAWLALLAVCTLSYASYLVQRYIVPGGSDLAVGLLGGLYSSTATTVVLARRVGAAPAGNGRAQAGIILATAVMYLRILAVVAVLNPTLAGALAPAALALSALGLVLAALQYWRTRGQAGAAQGGLPRNPLELSAAFLFAVLFVVVSIVASWAKDQFGATGVNALAAVVGVTDVDPFVLSLASGGAVSLPIRDAVTAILIATSSNNLLKAAYTASFAGGRNSIPAVAALIVLSGAAACAAFILLK